MSKYLNNPFNYYTLVVQEFVQGGGLNIFSFQGQGSALLGLKSPWNHRFYCSRCWALICPPPVYAPDVTYYRIIQTSEVFSERNCSDNCIIWQLPLYSEDSDIKPEVKTFLKGTVSRISKQIWQCPINNGKPFKVCLIKYEVRIRYQCFCFFKLFIFIGEFSAKVTYAFLAKKKQLRNLQK